jgi:hypothetical protein
MELVNNKRIPVAAQSKAWVCCISFVGIACSNPAGGTDVSLVVVVCCQVENAVSGRPLLQLSPTECGVSECNRGLDPLGAVGHWEKNIYSWKEVDIFLQH